MVKFELTHIVERVKKTEEYQVIIDLGLVDVTTEKNAKRGSIFFRTCLPAHKEQCYEYSIYSSGYLRIYNPGSDGKYGMAANCVMERNDTEEVIFLQYMEMLRKLPRIYNRKAKKEGLFKEIEVLENISNHKLPTYIAHKWKFGYVKNMFLKRLKKNTETELQVA